MLEGASHALAPRARLPATVRSLRSRLERVLRVVDQVSEVSGRAFAWLVLPLILGVTYEVGARYLFNAPTVWAYDLSYMLYASIFMLGAAYTLRHGAHVRTDFLYNNFSDRRKRRWTPRGTSCSFRFSCF